VARRRPPCAQIIGDRSVAAGEPACAQVLPEALGVVAAGVPTLLEIGDKTLKVGVAARTGLECGAAVSLDVALDGAPVQSREARDRRMLCPCACKAMTSS